MASPYESLGRRERQIMDVLFREGQATAADVREALPDPPPCRGPRAQNRGDVRIEGWDRSAVRVRARLVATTTAQTLAGDRRYSSELLSTSMAVT